MTSLIVKRARTFYRRYILAAVILLLPFVLQAVLGYLIPSQTNLINSITGTVTTETTYDLSITHNSPVTLPYTLTGSYAFVVSSLLSSAYTSLTKPDVTLSYLNSSSVNDYVLSLRHQDIKNIIYNYYGGMDLNATSPSKLTANIYYSMLAYHSNGNMLSEVDNLILMVANDYSTTKTITTTNSPIQSSNSLSNSTNFLQALAW